VLQPHRANGGLLAALLHSGERSESEWSSAASSGRHDVRPSISTPFPFLLLFPFDFLLFLRKQENEAGPPLQRGVGGVRELVQPSDGF